MSLDKLGIRPTRQVFENLSVPSLVEHAITRGEGTLASNGALIVKTYERTGRSPNDKFTVRNAETEERVWWGPNQPTSPETFEKLWAKATHYLGERDLFVVDAWACADPAQKLNVRVVSELAWHGLFAKQLFRRPTLQAEGKDSDWTVVSAPTFRADPEADGTNSEVFVSIDFSTQRVLILGTHYAGEIKKSIFTVLNYVLPLRRVLPMHCSANVGPSGDVALFFGLSGTGKTTLSADPQRRLIGDDEHGWSDQGIFNFEGGCYAKCIRLSHENEPQIWDAIKFGSVVENVVFDQQSGEVDYDDDAITENTRAAYPLEFIPGAVTEGKAGHARNVLFLAADAFGVLPPVALLTREQAAYHFLSGFTSKLAGTEAGMGSEPQVTFSTCFGSPFLPLHPNVYADMLMEKIEEHDARVYLINTGWTGGAYGVGQRIDLPVTRRIVSAAVNGEFQKIKTRTDPIFGFEIPVAMEGIADSVLQPRETWEDPGAYDAKAKELATRFQENFAKFSREVSDEVLKAGPVV